MFADKDQAKFRRAERVVGDVKNARASRGQYGNVKQFVEWVAQEGLDKPAFTNVGRWTFDEAAKKDVNVFVPWITVDIDNVDLVEAHEDAQQTLRQLEYLGYDLDRVVASFSGGKGFHIQVDSSQLGLAPFMSRRHAKVFLETFCMDVCSDRFWDPAVCSPRSLIRLTGSKHSRTGLHKRSFLGSEFLSKGLNKLMKNVRDDYESFEWPEEGGILRGPRKHLRRLFDTSEKRYRGKTNNGHFQGAASQKSGNILGRIKHGVSEGQEFGPKNFHIGRENAAFIMGCALIESHDSKRAAKDNLRQWNGLNDPPLPRARLDAQWRGAKRKMQYA